jgi:hypothetical protein
MEQQLQRIQEKLQHLLKLFSVLKKENSRLIEELAASHSKAEEYQKMADNLKQQVGILQLGTGEMNDTEKKEFEKRINTYLKEIDRCITLLESH